MAVQVIVELKAKAGRRDEMRSLIEQLKLLAGPFRATVVRRLP
jgi:hypothetical protein